MMKTKTQNTHLESQILKLKKKKLLYLVSQYFATPTNSVSSNIKLVSTQPVHEFLAKTGNKTNTSTEEQMRSTMFLGLSKDDRNISY